MKKNKVNLKGIFLFVLLANFLISNKCTGTITFATLNPLSGSGKVCENNTYHAQINISNPPSSFQFTLQALVRDGINIISAQPYPTCLSGSTVPNSINPARIILSNFQSSNTSCVPSVAPTGILGINNVYTYQVNISPSCAVNSIEITFDIAVFLDCSLIPPTPPMPAGQQLQLDVNGEITGNGQAPISVTTQVEFPFITDVITSTSQQAAHVSGNYGQTDDLIFKYQNVGADAVIDFNFLNSYFNSCATPGYILNSTQYLISAIPPTSGSNWLNFSTLTPGMYTGVGVSVGALETIYIRQNITILNCTESTVCPNFEREVVFNWRCTNAPTSCTSCQNEYVTPFVFDSDIPAFTIEFANAPATPPINEYDISCLGSAELWTVKVKNTSSGLITGSTIPSIDVLINNPKYTNGISIIYSNDLHITNVPTHSNGNISTTASFAIPAQGATRPCLTNGVGYALGNFTLTVNNLESGAEAEFTFKTTKCADTTGLMGINKAFNQWVATSDANSICGNTIEETKNLNTLGTGTLNGISSHSASDVKDVHLIVGFNAQGADIDVPPFPNTIPALAYRYGDVTEQENLFINLFGDDYDKQAIGYTGTTGFTLNGILLARIHCDKGLVVDNLYPHSLGGDVNLSYKDAASVWHDVVLHTVFTSNLVNPLNTNLSEGNQPFPNCESADYYFYYDLRGIPAADVDYFWSTAKFEYRMTSCCAAKEPGPVEYGVEYIYLRADNGCAIIPSSTYPPLIQDDFSVDPFATGTYNWLPLSRTGYYFNVHCPGCLAPGVIVDYYEMQRITFGFVDADNNRTADQPITQITNPLTVGARLDAGVMGDNLIDRLQAHFESGNDECRDPVPVPNPNPQPCTNDDYRGYNYSIGSADMQNVTTPNGPINLNVLQLHRTIPGGGCNKMSLKILSADLYIDRGPGNISTCLECAGFPNTTANTLYKINLTNAVTAGGSTLFFEEIAAGDDKDMMFTFHINDLQSITQTSQSLLGAYLVYPPTGGNLSTYTFVEDDQFRLVLTYKIVGNIHGDYPVPDPDDVHITSEIKNYMWLTGGTIGGLFPKGFDLAHEATQPQMPNIIYDVTNQNNARSMAFLGLDFTPASTNYACGSTQTPVTCLQASQTNLGDFYKFFCEPRNNTFHFYSSDFINVTGFSGVVGSTTCEKMIRTTTVNSFGGNINGDIFPNEFRPPVLVPYSFEYKNIPNGYNLKNSTGTPTVTGAYIYNGTTYVVPSPPNTGNPFISAPSAPIGGILNFSQQTHVASIGCLSSPFNTPPPPPANNLVAGDGWYRQVTEVFFTPVCGTATTKEFIETDAVVNFGLNPVGATCPTATYGASTTCEINGVSKINDYGRSSWIHPNPNLNLQFTPPQVTAQSSRVCWGFTMSNQNTSAAPPYTAAPGVYLEVPTTLTNSLTNWSLSYDYAAQTFTTGTLTPNLPPIAGNKFLLLFPIPNPIPGLPPITGSLFPVGAVTVQNGQVCADYSPCFIDEVTPLTFEYGWSCDNALGTTCGSEQATVDLINLKPNVQVQPGSQSVLPTTGLILCDAANNKYSAKFQNVGAGEAVASFISFSSLQNFNPTQINITDCSGSGNVYHPTLSGVPGQWDINPTAMASAFLWNTPGVNAHENMRFGDCINVEVVFNPLCQFDDYMDLPGMVFGYNSYCDLAGTNVKTIAAEFDDAVIAGTACNNCYRVTKIADKSSIVLGIEEVSFTFEICDNNSSSGTLSPVYLWDNYPLGFTPTNNPFGGGAISLNYLTNGTGGVRCSTLAVAGNPVALKGTYSGTGTSFDNIAELYDNVSHTGTTLATGSVTVNILQSCTTMYPPSATTYNIADGTMLTQVYQTAGFANATEYNVLGSFIINTSYTMIGKQIHMEAGAEISVNAGNTLRLKGVAIDECNKMYKGINLKNQAGLNGTLGSSLALYGGSFMRGAENAVKVNDFCTAAISDVRFEDNLVSVYVPPLINFNSMNQVALRISNTTFASAQNMPVPYNNIIVAGGKPLAGILVNQMLLNMIQKTGSANMFLDLSNGIILKRAGLLIDNAIFINMEADAAYTNLTKGSLNFDYNGSGIYGWGFRTGYTIEQTGIGRSTGIQPTFYNCKYGIVADVIGLRSNNNLMQDVSTAYHSRYARFETTIFDNTLETKENAIELINYDLADYLDVYSNDITFGISSIPINKYWGIKAYGISRQTDWHNINSNRIFYRLGANTAFGGIYANNTSGLRIYHNTLSMNNYDYNMEGILTSGSRLPDISCNFVWGDTHNPFDLRQPQSAITSLMNDDAQIGCNTMDYTVNGLSILGPTGSPASSATILGNNFNRHGYGLHYSLSALTNNQEHKGNRWYFGAQAGGLQAKHDNIALLTNIYYNTYKLVTGLPFTYEPTFAPANWWKSNPLIDNDQCNIGTVNDYCIGHAAGCANCRISMDEDIALGDMLNDPFTDETKWMLEKGLFEKIANNASLTNNSLLNYFYQSKQGSAIAQFKAINDKQKLMFEKTAAQLNTIAQYRSMQKLTAIAIDLQMQELETAIANNETQNVLDGLLATINATVNTMTQAEDVMMQFNDAMDNARYTLAVDANTDNEAVNDFVLLEENEKRINEVFLNRNGKDDFAYTFGEIAMLEEIANQCPVQGGMAVFEARSLLAQIDASRNYDDRDLCAQAGITLRKGQTKKGVIKNVMIVPNPAIDKATLVIKSPSGSKYYFSIYDFAGQIVNSITFESTVQYSFNTKALKPGVYHYKLRSENGDEDNGKFVIVR